MFSITCQMVPLIAGILLGIQICLITFYPNDYVKLKNRIKNINFMKKSSDEVNVDSPWNTSLADRLFDEIKVLCWIMTSPENHKKAMHVKNTWGKRCNKLLLMSSRYDAELDTIALPVLEGRTNLWDKTKSAFQYIQRNHYGEFDWVLKAGKCEIFEYLKLLPQNL